MNTFFLARLCLLALLAAPAFGAENWPQFRGPEGDGHSDAPGLPLTWSETNNVKWKTPIHGRAWSSPVVWGRQVWLTTASEDGKQLFAVGVDRDTGRVVHDLKLFEVERPQFAHKLNSYASPRPSSRKAASMSPSARPARPASTPRPGRKSGNAPTSSATTIAARVPRPSPLRIFSS